MLRDLTVHHCSCTFSCRLHLSNPSFSLLLGLLIFVIGFTQIANMSAPPVTLTLSVYALNANGLVQPVKQSNINSVIKARNPQAFVLGETKTKSKLRSSLPFLDYDIYEEPGEQNEAHHPIKWGIVISIQKDIQVAQRLKIRHRSLKGRVIAIDLVLLTSNRHCFPHRLIDVYAPWNPGDDGIGQLFLPTSANQPLKHGHSLVI